MSHQIVIADDDAGLLGLLSRRLRRLGFQVDEASDGVAASLALFVGTDPEHAPELIILDVNLPLDDGLSICEELKLDERLARIPVIVLTARSDKATVQRCQELGVHYLHKSGQVWKKLEALVRELTGIEKATSKADSASPVDRHQAIRTADDPTAADSTTPPPASANAPAAVKAVRPRKGPLSKVVVVGDDQVVTEAIQERLTAGGFDVRSASNCVDGYWTALKERPDIIVADHMMPDADGDYLIRRLREHPLTANTPVIVMTRRELFGRPPERSDPSPERQVPDSGKRTALRKLVTHQSLIDEVRRRLCDSVAASGTGKVSCP